MDAGSHEAARRRVAFFCTAFWRSIPLCFPESRRRMVCARQLSEPNRRSDGRLGSRTGCAMKMEPSITEDTSVESGSVCADHELPDATLVARVLDGKRGAFEISVRRHQTALFRRARWMGVDADTAADMVQDSLIKAYENLSSCREPDRFGFWAGQILRN